MRTLLISLIAVFAVVVAGCGSKEDAPAPTGGPAPEAATPPANKVGAGGGKPQVTTVEPTLNTNADSGKWEAGTAVKGK